MIKLHNNLTRKLEEFKPIDPKNVRIYACGPTVYDRAHLGNARPAVVFDVLARLLRHEFGAENVTYARNITDVDDKINARAAQTGRSIADVTKETTDWYHEDMDAIGVKRPDHEPRATQYIDEMIAMIGELIEKGHAYEAEGHVLFDVRSFENYGKFSGRSLDDMIAGARVEVAPFKRDGMDFVLWKPAGDGPGWDSPWGNGRPGWHIECSAMSRALLGEVFDIHAGGIDLQFPHHENEIAQSCACSGRPVMAKYWVHNEMLQVEGKKMSKSLGNFFTVRDLLDQGVAGEVIRFVLLSTHYASPMDWTEQKRLEAEKTLRKWRAMTDGVEDGEVSQDVVAALSNDLNTAGAIAALHGLAKDGDTAGLKASADLLGLLGDELRGWEVLQGEESLGGIRDEYLMALMKKFRDEKNYEMSDLIRNAYVEAGLQINQVNDRIHVGVNMAETGVIKTENLDHLYKKLKSEKY